MEIQKRQLGTTPIEITPVAMGCWPIAGMTSIDVNDHDSRKTLQTAFESGINFFDTAYCYGARGESERLISQTLGQSRDEIVIATKCGIHWDADTNRVQDASPARVRLEIDESLQRLETDHVELLYLHAPDPNVPIEQSAAALLEIQQSGKARSIGVSNANLEQLIAFHAICPIAAIQPPFNMLQQDEALSLVPWCLQNQISVIVYWPLMKGLLAGKIPRDHQFAPEDGRAKYPMFQGEQWQKNQDFMDVLRGIANSIDRTVAQVVINWTIHQTGITCALAGSKRDYQIAENAGAMGWRPDSDMMEQIDQAIIDRGEVITRAAV